MNVFVNAAAAGLVGVSLMTSSAAVAAQGVPTGSVATSSPLVTLSVFGTAGSRAALCSANSAAVTGAAATAVVQARPGCVLPALDAPPVISDVPPPAPYAAAPYAASGPNLWPLLASLAVFSAVFFLLDDVILGDGDSDGITLPPPCTGSPC